ncbi:MAG: IS630 family transposase [Draconibacterium sp.]
MKRYKVTLTEQEKQQLSEIASKGSHKSQKVINALILLNCDRGDFQDRKSTNAEIGHILQTSMKKIDRVKKRFVEEGLNIALEGHKGERVYKKKVDGDLEAHLIALSCSQPPEGFSRWSLRTLADKAVELEYVDEISHETVRRVLKKNELKPWKKQGWVIPPLQNGDFVANMEKVLEVYKRPYNPNRPVVCMDESPKQLIGETKTPIMMKPGCEGKHDYEYVRKGVCNIFMSNEPLKGKRHVKVTKTKTKEDWAGFLSEIAGLYRDAEKITLVMDNLNTHKPGSLYETYKCLNRRIDTIDKVEREVRAWQNARNNMDAKINWQFSTEDARIKLRRLYPTFDE